MTVSWSTFIKWLVQIGFVCAVTVFGLELAARVFLPDDISYWRSSFFGDQRYGFFSKGAFQNKVGYFNFRPNSKIRDIAYYPDSNGNLTVEYDCTFNSDELGFVSNARDYRETSILLLGDSFAQGEGGCAWIPRLDPVIRARVYSAAVMGFGVLHWSHVVSDLEKLKKPDKILIIFITDDFYRTDWVYRRQQMECIEGRGNCSRSYWYPISSNLAAVAAKRYADRNRPRGIVRALKYHLIATYGLYRIMTGAGPDQEQVLKRSLAVISEWSKKYDVKLLWVNEKHDSARSSARAKAVARGLTPMKIARCDIPPSGFLPRDPHPNASGYDVLKACVQDIVRSW